MDNDNLRGVTVSGTINSEFTHRRLQQRRLAGARRHPAAGRRDPGVQGRDRGLRRAGRPHRRRQREPRAEERHQRSSTARPPTTTATTRARPTCSPPTRAAATSRPATTTASARTVGGPIIKQQDVLHGVVREAAGRHHRDVHQLGADRAHAQRRLLGAARRRHPDLRPATRRGWSTAWSRAIRSRATSSRRTAQPGRAQRPEATTRCPTRRAPPTSSSNYFVEQPWTYGYDFQMARVDHQWTDANRTYVPLHPQLPPRGALQLGGRAERRRHHARRHRPLQLNVAARPHRGPVADAGSST